jgi:hypothetical protein
MMAVLVLTVILVLGVLGVMLRRATCLIGLPDIGDPNEAPAGGSGKFRASKTNDAIAFLYSWPSCACRCESVIAATPGPLARHDARCEGAAIPVAVARNSAC